MADINTINSIIHGFKLTKLTPIPELKCTLRELVHIKSKASIIQIENDDPENVFCLSFQTLPSSSNGVAHILEHTVLCGSKKFPIKDPFFAMNRRSLNTFMNALTGSDFTCYPAASQISQDFYNLLDVYIDAVFHPNLNEKSFEQEGHRLEFENPEDSNSLLTYRGIVFNEMKGAMNSPSARMHEILFQALFPTLTYGINSGGDPKHIPELTHQELLEFHKTYYHPSRCLFFFYGNMDLRGHLEFLENTLLKEVQPVPPLQAIPKEKRFSSPKSIVGNYPIAKNESLVDKSLISFGWLTCSINDAELCLALGILEIILLDTDASLLKKALLGSGLCKHVSAYMDTEISEVPFTITLKGCSAENADALEALIKKTLQNIVEEGVPIQLVENAIHQFEFHRCEITGDYYPFGLTLFMRSALQKQHGGDVEHGLLFHSLFNEISKKAHESKNYFTDLIEKFLLNNPHFVRVVLNPDPDLEDQELADEKKHLEQIKNNLRNEDAAEIIQHAKDLLAFQKEQEEEDQDILPKLTLSDIPINPRELSLEKESLGSMTLYYHDCFTNDIGYADLFCKLPPLNKEELIHLRLLTVVLHQMGSGERSYEDSLELIQGATGGISSYLTLNIQANDHTHFSPSFAIRGKALYRNLEKLFSLLKDFISKPNLQDRARLKSVIHKHWINLEGGLNQNALKYAINLSTSCLSEPSYIANLWYGLDYYYEIKRLVNDFDNQVDGLIASLTALANKVMQNNPYDLVLSMDHSGISTLRKNDFYKINEKPLIESSLYKQGLLLPTISSQGRIISSPVAYIGHVFSTVPYTHPDAPSLNLASFLFDNLTLHKKIREEGGAYGGGAVSNALSGNFYFYSYRDPHIVSSLNAFEESIHHVVKGQFDDQDLEEAKFELIQELDSPIAPGSRADAAYGWLEEGKTSMIRRAFRDRLLSATEGDIIAAVQRHIAPLFASGKTIVFASQDLLEKANEALKAEGKKELEITSI
jgi:Zn-dependent M16 (insulinase) family peptidase